MGKTFEALIQAEKERLEKLGDIPPAPFPTSHLPILPKKLEMPSSILEEYHRMEYKISSRYSENRSKVLLFVGPNEGEGNSTVLTHFGITLACGGNRVLLVDTNVRRPSMHRLFDLPLEKGFVELLLKKYSLEDVLKSTSLENLQVVTSGKTPSEAFPSLTFSSLDLHIEAMRTKADWILFDAPPILTQSDAIVLAPKVDGVVMVIRAEKTRWEVAQNARQRIENGKGNILGVVLNERQFYIPGWVYERLG